METDRLDATFSALSDATRRAILGRLAAGEATVAELAAPFAISQPAISRHLRVLEQAGLILRRVDGTRRPSRLASGGLGELNDYLSMLRDAMESNYARLDELLAETAAPTTRTTRTTRTAKKSKRKKPR